MLLDLVDSLDARIAELTAWITDAIEAMPGATGPEPEGRAGAACPPLVCRTPATAPMRDPRCVWALLRSVRLRRVLTSAESTLVTPPTWQG
jgi:hypothetical protein